MTGFLMLIPLSLGLSTDAFAASLARGGRRKTATIGMAIRSGAVFGFFEGAMCAAGWIGAASFAEQIRALDHWIALVLLAVIGGKMIHEGVSPDDDEGDHIERSGLVGTAVTALGTSIDSAAVGIALALSGMPLVSAVVIGLFSFVASSVGFLIGPVIGTRLGKGAEIGGGVILILIGVGIFVSHMTGGG